MAWQSHDLHDQAGAPLSAAGPAAYFFAAESTRHVIVLASGGPDGAAPGHAGHLSELYAASDGVWHTKDITSEADAPAAVAAPTAYAFEAEGTQHVLYQTGDGHLHELYQSDGWHHNDLNDAAGIAPRVVGQAFGWASKTLARQFVVFRMTDARVHLLSRVSGGDGGWQHTVLTGGSDPRCVSDPAGYTVEPTGETFVTYCDEAGAVHEISRATSTGTWERPVDLWQQLPQLPPGIPVMPSTRADRPRGYADEFGVRYIDIVAFGVAGGGGADLYEYAIDGAGQVSLQIARPFGAPAPLQGHSPVGYPIAASRLAARSRQCIYLGVVGNDTVIQELQNSGSWASGSRLDIGDGVVGDPAAFVDGDGVQRVFFTTASGHLIEQRWSRFAHFPPVPPSPLHGRFESEHPRF